MLSHTFARVASIRCETPVVAKNTGDYRNFDDLVTRKSLASADERAQLIWLAEQTLIDAKLSNFYSDFYLIIEEYYDT